MRSFPLLTWQGTQTQIGFCFGTRPVVRDEMAKVIGATAITTFADHHIQSTGGERGKLLENLADKGQIRVDL
jgi:hypothetical protein